MMKMLKTIQGYLHHLMAWRRQADHECTSHIAVYEELKGIAQRTGGTNDDISMAIAIYLLGFSTYKGFSNNDELLIDFMTENCGIERIYQYAKGI